MKKIPLSPIHWVRSFRIISGPQSERKVFRSIASPQEAEILYALDGVTRPPRSRRVDFVNDCFRYRSTSRFSNGDYGVYYAAKTIDTAIKETRHHRALFLSKTTQPSMDIPMRAYVANIQGTFHDIRGMRKTLSTVYSPRESDYNASQAFARELRGRSSKGLVFSSVRDPRGQCVAVFDPACISNAHEERNLIYHWDGKGIPSVSEVKTFLTFS